MPTSIHRKWLVLLVALFVLAGCATSRVSPPPSVAAIPPAPPKPARAPAQVGREQTGRASWYGEPHHGKKTSSGEVYDMHGLTAAHRTLPLDTRVRVTNLDNGQSVEVRINDRGPFVAGRILDLSRAAARQLGPLGAGVFRIRLTVVALPDGSGPAAPESEAARR